MVFLEVSNKSALGKEVRRNLYNEFCDDNDPEIVKIKRVNLFGFKIDLYRDQSYCSSARKFFDLISVIFYIKLIFRWLLVVVCSLVSSREHTLFRYLEFRFDSLLLGDCILSQWFRESGTNCVFTGSLASKLSVLFIGCKVLGYVVVGAQIVRTRTDIPFFFMDETTGKTEALRRVFCVFSNMAEIRFNQLTQKFGVINQCIGVDIRKFYHQKAACYEDISEEELKRGQSMLRALVYREVTYRYLVSSDVDTSVVFPTQDPNLTKKAVVIFLATISDAQYLFGVGPYADLHHWLMHSIKISLRYGYSVYIKIHPAMYRSTGFSAKDQAYLRFLRNQFDVSDYGTVVEKTRFADVFFVDSSISVRELSKGLPRFICLTPHGSVAAEAAFLGHRAIVNVNSQFGVEDKFVEITSDLSDLDAFLSNEPPSYTRRDIARSLGCYIWFMMIRCNDHFTDEILERMGGSDISSELIDDWLNQKLVDPIFRKKFSTICANFVKSRVEYSKRTEIDNDPSI